MKILLIGSGSVGSVISKLLSKEKQISKIICASNNIKEAKKFINQKNKKIKLIKLDASDIKQVVKAAKGADLIINASLPNFNENIMEAALKVKANYQDLCSHLKDLKTPEQLKFHNRFKKAKLVGLINTGIAPGITNLLSKEIADRLDKVEEIKIRLLEEQKASEFVFSWSPEVTLDELSAPPLTYKNGKFKLLKAFGDLEEYNFPHPFGKRYTVNIYGDEISTIPLYIKVKNVDFKSSGSDIDVSKMIYRLGLLNKKPIYLNKNKIVPLEFFTKMIPKIPSPNEMSRMIDNGIIENAVFISIVEGIGIEAGRRIKIKNTVVYPDLKQISKIIKGSTYISYPTGLTASAFSKIIPKIKEYGVFPPEALDAGLRKEVLIDLENKGIVVDEQFSKA
jgi:saccharopine dehydrogenase-like NADP-dependent oxidoreductase